MAVRGWQFCAFSRQLRVSACAHISSGQGMDVRLASIEKATVLHLSSQKTQSERPLLCLQAKLIVSLQIIWAHFPLLELSHARIFMKETESLTRAILSIIFAIKSSQRDLKIFLFTLIIHVYTIFAQIHSPVSSLILSFQLNPFFPGGV